MSSERTMVMDRRDIPLHRAVQAKAKAVLKSIGQQVTAGMSEADVAGLCVELLRDEGITDTWYYDVPAFVLVQDRSVLSLSGRDYRASEDIRLAL